MLESVLGMARRVAALGLVTVAAEASAQPWSESAPLPDPRQEVAVAALGGRVYVVGGIRQDASLADTVEVYDPDTDTWSLAAPFPSPVHHAGAASVGGKLYVIGGWSNFFGAPLDTVYAYDPATDAWTQKQPMPSARGGLAVAVLDGQIYAAGGSGPATDRTGPSQDFAVYDPELDTWTVLADMPTPRNHLSAGAVNGRFYAAGGRSSLGAGVGNLSVLEEYDPATGAWHERASMLAARGGTGAAVVGRYLLVFGGEGNVDDPDGVFADADAYDSVLDVWLALTPMPTPRHGIGAAAIQARVHIPGGGPVEGFGVTGVHEVLDVTAELSVECDDGVDNDGDGRIDFDPMTLAAPGDENTLPAGTGDPVCKSPAFSRENARCQDGVDNDGDGKMDYDAGLSVNGVADPAGPDPQCVGKPWRNKERTGCGLGFELVLLVPLLAWFDRRRRLRRV